MTGVTTGLSPAGQWSTSGHRGAVALTVGSVLRWVDRSYGGTILNHVIFVGRCRGQPIRQPIKNDVILDCPTRDRPKFDSRQTIVNVFCVFIDDRQCLLCLCRITWLSVNFSLYNMIFLSNSKFTCL